VSDVATDSSDEIAEAAAIGERLREATKGLQQVSRDRWQQVAHLRRDLLGDEAGALEAEREAGRIRVDDDTDGM
jgi:predicted component of type VI protein secretion system